MGQVVKVDANGLTRFDRYRLRRAGVDVPKMKPGVRSRDFDSLIDKSGECWIWTGDVNADGNGVHRVDGKTHQAHRTMLERSGPIAADLVVMHSCDNPPCVNPAHLRAATQAENIADKVAKDRQAKGARVGSSRLTEEQVIAIRARYRPRICTYLMLAREHGVCKDTIQKAVRGINWGHLA